MEITYEENINHLNKVPLTPNMDEKIRKSLAKYLRGAEGKITDIKILLRDINGPYEGGIDKECMIQARIPSVSKEVVVSDLDENVEGAIEKATFRFSRKIHFLSGHYWRRQLFDQPFLSPVVSLGTLKI